MDRSFRSEIACLLGEPDDRPDADGVRRLLRARLAASMMEGVSGEARGEDNDPGELAQLAAFLDGRLSPAERDALVAALAQDPRRLADWVSAAALVQSVDADPPVVPAGLLSRAAAEFAPAKTSGIAQERSPRPAWRLGRRAVWAGMAAVLLVAVVAPSVWLTVGGRPAKPSGPDGEPSPIRAIVPQAVPPQTALPSQSPTVAPQLRSQRAPAEGPAAAAQPAPPPAPLERSCDDVAERKLAQQTAPAGITAGRRANTSLPKSRLRDPCSPGAPDEPADKQPADALKARR